MKAYILNLLKDPQALKDFLIRCTFFAIGFSPITSVSLSTFKLIPLHYSGPLVVFPAILLAIGLCWKYRSYAPRVVEGLLLGITAVTLYDLTRMPFLATGMWPDFIPKIGSYLLNQDPNGNYSLTHWSLGYLWRYIGNGGGMGLAFYMMIPLLKPSIDRRVAGVVYGVGIFCCLLATLYLSPAGTVYLFNPSVFTASLGLLGHIVYGLVLGMGVHYLKPNHGVSNDTRTRFVVDRSMQYKTGAAVCLIAFSICAANFLAFVNFSDLFVSAVAQSNVLLERRSVLTVLGVTQLFLILSIFSVVMVVTNRIVAPIYRFRKHLALIREGNLEANFKLRPNDYLSKELTAEFNATLNSIRLMVQTSSVNIESDNKVSGYALKVAHPLVNKVAATH